MFKENLEKSIGLLLRENGHELVEQNEDCIFYVKKISDGLAFHVRCFHYDKYQSCVRITLFFTTEDISYEDIIGTTMGLKITIVITGPERDFHKVLSDNFPTDTIIAAGKKILVIEEALGAEARKVIWEEAHV